MQNILCSKNYSLLPCCQKNLDTLKNSDVVEVATKYEQGSSTWSKERELRITGKIKLNTSLNSLLDLIFFFYLGSTCYSVFTYQKSDDWETKAKKFFFPKHFTNKFVEHGRKYEKEAVENFENKYGCRIVRPGLVICKMMPWLAFSPDGVIFNDDGPCELLEVKCPFIGMYIDY